MDMANVSAFTTVEYLRAATEQLAAADPRKSSCAAAAAAAAASVFVSTAMPTDQLLLKLICFHAP
jgi:hypothetical protein